MVVYWAQLFKNFVSLKLSLSPQFVVYISTLKANILLLYPRHLCRRVYSFCFSVCPFVCSLVRLCVRLFVSSLVQGCSRKIHGGGADRKRIFFFVVGGVI